MRAELLTLLLLFAKNSDSAAIEEDFGKFIKSARPFRPSENAKVSDLAKGKKIRRRGISPVFWRARVQTGCGAFYWHELAADGGHTWVNIYRKYSPTADVPLYWELWVPFDFVIVIVSVSIRARIIYCTYEALYDSSRIKGKGSFRRCGFVLTVYCSCNKRIQALLQYFSSIFTKSSNRWTRIRNKSSSPMGTPSAPFTQ